MRPKLLPAAVLLAVITAGCSVSAPKESPSPAHPTTPVVDEHKRPQPPATPIHGERVPEQSLPAELSAWKEAKPGVPGGISRVVGGSLYVVASPGAIADDAYGFTIGDVKVQDQRVEIEAYLVRTKSDGKQGRIHPKDYVKIAYRGSANELPVELKISYDSAAFAHVRGSYDVVDRAFLPDALSTWLRSNKTSGGKAAVFGEYLYVMVSAGERMKEGEYFHLGDVELKGDHVAVIASLAPSPDGAPANLSAESTLFARLPFKGDKSPDVKVDIREVVLVDLSKIDRVVVKHSVSKKEKEFTQDEARRLVKAIGQSPAIPLPSKMASVPLELEYRLYSGSNLVAEAVGRAGDSALVVINGENTLRHPSGEPMQLLRSVGDSLK